MIMTNRQFIELWFFLCSCKTVWYGADGTLFQAFYFLRSDYRHFGCCHYCPYDYRADLQIKEKGNLTNSKLTKERDCMKKMILGIVWQLMGFLGSIIILCSVAPHEWDYNGITGILGSLLGLGLIIPLIVCIIFFICGVVVCFKAIGEK